MKKQNYSNRGTQVIRAPERAVICVCLTELDLLSALNVCGRACVCVFTVDQPTDYKLLISQASTAI